MAKKDKDNILVRTTGFFFTRWKLTLMIWLLLVGLGTYTYTSVIKREGFPPISFPISFVSGAYPGESKEVVDQKIAVPISEALSAESAITDVEATSNDGFFTAAISFDDTVTSETGTELVERVIDEQVTIPQGSFVQTVPVDPGSFLFEFDLVIQVYTTGEENVETLDEVARYVAAQIQSLEIVEEAEAKTNIEGEGDVRVQTSFTRVAISSQDSDEVQYFGASTVGVKQVSGADALELSDDIEALLADLDLSQFGGEFNTIISADFATNIRSDISFLQSNMATGLLAVAFVSFLLISWRASLITGLFMVTVMLTTIMILYLIGYTLNVITLFALILSLGLFVDDATIAVEAIDVNRRDKKLKSLDAAKNAVRKVGMASLAGTLTTVLVFAILAAPTGILGEFIRLIPITVIVALLTSFVLSMTLIPFFSRFLILRDRKISWITRVNPILKAEEWLSKCIEKIILLVRSRKGKFIAAGAFIFSIVAIQIGFYIFGFKVDNNTFPPSKDTDQIGIQIQFTEARTVEEASEVTREIDAIVARSVGDQIVFGAYFGERLPDAQQATVLYDIVPFTDRDIKAPEIVEQLQADIDAEFSGGAVVNIRPVDNGPPASQFPFGIRVYSDDQAVLETATQAFADELVGVTMENFNGEEITVLESEIDGISQEILRENADRYAITRFAYDSENPTLVALLTEEEFNDRFTDEELEALGITREDVQFDSGQEGDFQESFNTLALAVPVALLLMYILLAVQFRSFMQPFLILLAIPFSLFGVAYGLFITDNAASFFSLVGFIGLIGIAVNNTIMLTDYANQERRNGAKSVEAIAAAARKRLRPLITTTVTTIVALLPLALSDPFWEALAFTIIFGLLSSTLFVLVSFPYYYLGAEWLRMRFSRGTRRARKANRKAKKAGKTSPSKTAKTTTQKTTKKTTAKKKK